MLPYSINMAVLMWKKLLIYAIFCLICLLVPVGVKGWDGIGADGDPEGGWGNDYELFDLVEEINANFYTLLDVDQSADAAAIRRAYRKVSLQLHPDKNKEPDAEIKFRNLVSAYEILKDEARRKRYNYILVHGLPDWRQPVYYYRRVRKMGLFEISVLLAIILTVGHFVVMWSMYFERRFEKEEVFRSRKKRERKNRRAKGGSLVEDEVDEQLEAELQNIERPLLSNILPIITAKAVFRGLIALPQFLKAMVEEFKAKYLVKMNADAGEADNCDSTLNKRIRHKRNTDARVLPEAYDDADNWVDQDQMRQNREIDHHDSNGVNISSSSEWTEAEFAALLKAVARYPGGTPGRWEKIAAVVGRSTSDVTARAQQIKKTSFVCAVDASAQGITASSLAATFELPTPTSTTIDDAVGLATAENSEQPNNNHVNSVSHRRHKPSPAKNPERTLMIGKNILTTKAGASDGSTTEQSVDAESVQKPSADLWTQHQQRLLEKAMVQFPKGTDERWDRVAMMVPGKTKDECLERYRQLVLRIKEKQQQQQSKDDGNAPE